MKPTAIVLLLAAAAGGCIPPNFVLPTTALDKNAVVAADKKPAAADVAKKPRTPVTAGQVTTANAHEKAQELRDEIDNDMLGHLEVQEKDKDK